MNKKGSDEFDLDVVSSDAEPRSSSVSDRATLEEKTLALDHDRATRQQELGLLGTWFGGRAQASIYGVGLIGIVALVGLILIGSFTADLRGELFKVLGAIVIAALGYLGGSHTSGR